MTKIKRIILSVALALMIVPCAILFAACGCTPGQDPTTINPILGDWKTESMTFTDGEGEETVTVGDEWEGEGTLKDNFFTAKFTETKVQIKAGGEEVGNPSYTKEGNVYTTEAFGDEDSGKAVFTLLANGKLKLEALNYNSETEDFEREGTYYILVKGTASGVTPEEPDGEARVYSGNSMNGYANEDYFMTINSDNTWTFEYTETRGNVEQVSIYTGTLTDGNKFNVDSLTSKISVFGMLVEERVVIEPVLNNDSFFESDGIFLSNGNGILLGEYLIPLEGVTDEMLFEGTFISLMLGFEDFDLFWVIGDDHFDVDSCAYTLIPNTGEVVYMNDFVIYELVESEGYPEEIDSKERVAYYSDEDFVIGEAGTTTTLTIRLLDINGEEREIALVVKFFETTDSVEDALLSGLYDFSVNEIEESKTYIEKGTTAAQFLASFEEGLGYEIDFAASEGESGLIEADMLSGWPADDFTGWKTITCTVNGLSTKFRLYFYDPENAFNGPTEYKTEFASEQWWDTITVSQGSEPNADDWRFTAFYFNGPEKEIRCFEMIKYEQLGTGGELYGSTVQVEFVSGLDLDEGKVTNDPGNYLVKFRITIDGATWVEWNIVYVVTEPAEPDQLVGIWGDGVNTFTFTDDGNLSCNLDGEESTGTWEGNATDGYVFTWNEGTSSGSGQFDGDALQITIGSDTHSFTKV